MRELLSGGLKTLGIDYTEEVLDKFSCYWKLLQSKNKVMNLTAITDETEAVQLHFLDCAAVLRCIDLKNISCIDIGTGAGFPGLVLKLLEPSLDLTLFDSLEKRLEFLRNVGKELNLSELKFVHGRAEEAAHDENLREKFDVATARAVARLDLLCELCLPFVRVGGKFLAMNSIDTVQELNSALPVAKRLGAKFEDSSEYIIPGTDISRLVSIFFKTESTLNLYPRRWAKLQKVYSV